MDGIFIGARRPKSKKEIKEMVASAPMRVVIESTSMHPSPKNYDGPVSEAPEGRYDFVGPDPYRDRKFYGSITVSTNRAGDRVVKVS